MRSKRTIRLAGVVYVGRKSRNVVEGDDELGFEVASHSEKDRLGVRKGARH